MTREQLELACESLDRGIACFLDAALELKLLKARLEQAAPSVERANALGIEFELDLSVRQIRAWLASSWWERVPPC